MNGTHSQQPGAGAALHGMLIFGTGPTFLSHLPMFHAPHDHQLILEVEFSGLGDPQATYVADRARSREPVYTWVPRPFVLTDLLNPAGAPDMQGSIVRGHFERDGTPITGGDVRCAVRLVVHAQPLSAAGQRDTELRSVVFGPPSSTFAAHLISGPPDFDHVIRVDATPSRPDAVVSVVVTGRGNDSLQRVKSGDRVPVANGGVTTTLEGREEIYLAARGPESMTARLSTAVRRSCYSQLMAAGSRPRRRPPVSLGQPETNRVSTRHAHFF